MIVFDQNLNAEDLGGGNKWKLGLEHVNFWFRVTHSHPHKLLLGVRKR